jgi:16S rRNA (adenine1518-N6/adenine1519-N6)-dimethyltransferase
LKTKEKYELYKPKKFFGQNFLVDDNISKKIIKQIEPFEEDTVLEIGPGQGALTKHLAGNCKKYIAIEIDKDISEMLKIKFGKKAQIINEDFLKYDLSQFNNPVKIIGNLPYNIASEILFKLFDHREKIISAVLMVQKEFAKRIVASPDTKDYGILSVQTQAFSRPEFLFNVPPTVFFPKPKVTSSVIKLVFSENVYNISDINTFKTLVRSAFSKRRKILKNSLAVFFGEYKLNYDDYEAFFDFNRRAENVTVKQYVNLTNRIFEKDN